ncbi:putative RNA-directed DNA polymerase from transposon BS [Labeo rohita]|uniref:RNA-directed DNA polymerase from transposon BS n=1 Tax=Labeo rohita TaxID=84645 RepID=A0ABQ8MEQ3_LABRO|nr:putative RNA-directed DNA polymerase from transposon BS [Labeo rohita]
MTGPEMEEGDGRGRDKEKGGIGKQGNIMWLMECKVMKEAVQIKKVRMGQKVSYAEAVKMVRNQDTGSRSGSIVEDEGKQIQDNQGKMMQVNVRKLVTFIAGVINGTAEIKSKTERIQLIVMAAERHLDETWLRPNLDFVIRGYVAVRRDRDEGSAGGCATFIKQGLPYRILGLGKELEYVVVEVPLWGGKKLDRNGQVIEELLDLKGLVCLNDGRGTRFDVVSGNESVLDLTITSNDIARLCDWEIWKDSMVGSDHFPILCSIQMRREKQFEEGGGRWVFGKANWVKFNELCEERLEGEINEMDIDREYSSFQEVIKGVADETIPKSSGKRGRKSVPWWTGECRRVIKDRNRTFRLLRRTHNFEHLIQYKRAQALVKKTIRQAKRSYWRHFCSSIGSMTPVGDVWGMIKRMGGERTEREYPVLMNGEEKAVKDKEKAELIAKAFVAIHSSDNLEGEWKEGREKTVREYPGVLEKRGEVDDAISAPFSMAEMKRAINRAGMTSPGGDDICYIMLKFMGEKALGRLIRLYNRMRRKGSFLRGGKKQL